MWNLMITSEMKRWNQWIANETNAMLWHKKPKWYSGTLDLLPDITKHFPLTAIELVAPDQQAANNE